MFWFSLLLVCSSVGPLYLGLDPCSVAQHLALYELYPDTEEGQRALERAWELLGGEAPHLSASRLFTIVQQFAFQKLEEETVLSADECATIERLSTELRRTRGHQVWTEAEMVGLSADEIDVARGMLLSLLGEDQREVIRSYEALLDLMALQILARTSFDARPEEKIRAINHFLFDEMYLRFPPHSAWAKDIDLYTFLPAILDSRRGVCLGVSSLYLCLAQRLALPLEAVTPPGHIYVRYRDDEKQINIETTARGIDLPDETYLGVPTKELEVRDAKEVIGMTFFNQAAALWQHGRNEEAVTAYEKARLYVPDDRLTKELLGYLYWIVGREEEGRALLTSIRDVEPSPLLEDLLDGKAPIKGVLAVYQHVDETRESILAKQAEIQALLVDYPQFRSGWFHLAVTYLQLGREREAQTALQSFHALDTTDPVVEYYLAMTSVGRNDFPRAWEHLHNAESLTADYSPRAIRDLRRALRTEAPE